MKKLILNYKGRDSWDRPVYESEGRLYVDVDPRKGWKPNVCTKYNNELMESRICRFRRIPR